MRRVPWSHVCMGGGALDVEELKISAEERRRHVEHVRRHQEVDEHRLQDLVPEVAGGNRPSSAPSPMLM